MKNNLLFLATIACGILVTSCTPPTYRKVTVTMVPPAFLDVDVMIAEHNGQKDLYFLPDGAVNKCKIENGSTISIQTLADSPQGVVSSVGAELQRDAEELDKRFSSFIVRSTKPLNERAVNHILGCDVPALLK